MGSAGARPTSLRVRLGLVAVVFMVLVMIAVGLSALMLRSWDRTLDRRVEVRQTAGQVAELRLAYSDQDRAVCRSAFIRLGLAEAREPVSRGA